MSPVIVYQCPSGKLRHPTKRGANRALNGQRRAGMQVFRIYKCKECKGFHLTSWRETAWKDHQKVAV